MSTDENRQNLRSALDRFKTATVNLDRAWEQDGDGSAIHNYPKHLPSFDEFALEVLAMTLDSDAAIKALCERGENVEAATLGASEGLSGVGTFLPLEGSVWRLTAPVDRYPHFTVGAGAVGRVVEAKDDMIRLKLAVRFDGIEEWDNEIVWTDNDDEQHTGGNAAVPFYSAVEPATEADYAADEREARVTVEVDGMEIAVDLTRAPDGSPVLTLNPGKGVTLTGDEPGRYTVGRDA